MKKRLFIDICESVKKGSMLGTESFLTEIEDVLSKSQIISEYGKDALIESQLAEHYGEEVLQEAIDNDSELNQIYEAICQELE
jgi:hypothetical protein